jgi:hypothetical protein
MEAWQMATKNRPYTAPSLFRTGIIRSFDQEPMISETGGAFDAGFIKSFAVIATGESLGEETWVDEEFITRVSEQLIVAKSGIKSRYFDSGMSGDAQSKGLGRIYFHFAGDGKVRVDLHFWKAKHDALGGNLAAFLIQLASEYPESFGASISFTRDVEAEESYAAANPQSSDPRNVNNYRHVRLDKLKSIDIVNLSVNHPEALSSRDENFAEAELLVA